MRDARFREESAQSSSSHRSSFQSAPPRTSLQNTSTLPFAAHVRTSLRVPSSPRPENYGAHRPVVSLVAVADDGESTLTVQTATAVYSGLTAKAVP